MSFGRHVRKLSGYAAALPTPFDDGGKVDVESFQRLCALQITHGTTALVVCGTTGEVPTLTRQEHIELVRIAAQVSRGRVPVIAGAGSNGTAHAVELSKDAEDNGADAILSVVPYYNRPTQEGLLAHFREIAASTDLPLILYDVPSRTARGLADETVVRLAEMQQIIGLKDATGDIARPGRLRPLVGPDFRLLSGDDATTLGFLAVGGDGCISVTSNVAPGLCRDMFLAWKQRNLACTQRLTQPLALLTAALFRESNPAPLKYALSLLGLASPKMRLPLVEPSDQVKNEIAGILAQLCDQYSGSMIGRIGGQSHPNLRAMAG
jgi:4-hydroxy-tetrahydrodipicolinate synthase